MLMSWVFSLVMLMLCLHVCLCLCSCTRENQHLVGRDKHSGNFTHRIWQKSTLSDACLYQECKCVNSLESIGYPSANYSNLLARVRYTKWIWNQNAGSFPRPCSSVTAVLALLEVTADSAAICSIYWVSQGNYFNCCLPLTKSNCCHIHQSPVSCFWSVSSPFQS